MLNLILTRNCNRRCSYCFALDLRNQKDPEKVTMSDEMFEDCLKLARDSRAPEIRLLGGEPTLHPRFVDFVKRAFEDGLNLRVFSNGLIPDKVMEFLEPQSEKKLRMLINVNPQSTYTDKEWEKLITNLKALGRKANCGFNIMDPEFEADYLIDVIRDCGLYRGIRLGLTHPTLSGSNEYLDWEKAPDTAAGIIKLAKKADAHDIVIGFDCGFTLCMFEGFFDDLVRYRVDHKFNCRPVLDITPDGMLWHCLSLWGQDGVPLGQYAHADEYRDHFREKYGIYRNFGVTENCADCKYRRTGNCSGGCLVRNMRAWK